ncbi:MAG: hypothetical protein H0W64_09265 [Gammaproteobacteria bacterium]|nr:hypothetical protein [Gammaproteobacteria bacterium]
MKSHDFDLSEEDEEAKADLDLFNKLSSEAQGVCDALPTKIQQQTYVRLREDERKKYEDLPDNKKLEFMERKVEHYVRLKIQRKISKEIEDDPSIQTYKSNQEKSSEAQNKIKPTLNKIAELLDEYQNNNTLTDKLTKLEGKIQTALRKLNSAETEAKFAEENHRNDLRTTLSDKYLSSLNADNNSPGKGVNMQKPVTHTVNRPFHVSDLFFQPKQKINRKLALGDYTNRIQELIDVLTKADQFLTNVSEKPKLVRAKSSSRMTKTTNPMFGRKGLIRASSSSNLDGKRQLKSQEEVRKDVRGAPSMKRK